MVDNRLRAPSRNNLLDHNPQTLCGVALTAAGRHTSTFAQPNTPTDMPHEFEVTVDSSMMKTAWHAWFFREQRIWTLVVAAGIVMVSAYFDSRSGGLGAASIIGLILLALAVVIFLSAYFIGLHRSLSKLDMITDGRAAYRLTDEAIEARSSLGSVSLAWTAIAELRRYRDLVLLGFRGSMYSIVPASQIPAESLAFLVERCRAAGAQITDL